MTYSIKDLTIEIKQIIAEALEKGVATSAAFIAMAVIARHPFPSSWAGTSKDFAKVCVHGFVRDAVHHALRPVKKEQDERGGDPQLTMEGFSRLQRAYIIERDDDLQLVPVDKIEDAELLSKADDYDLMADGCREHADEIRRFVRERKQRIAS